MEDDECANGTPFDGQRLLHSERDPSDVCQLLRRVDDTECRYLYTRGPIS